MLGLRQRQGLSYFLPDPGPPTPAPTNVPARSSLAQYVF